MVMVKATATPEQQFADGSSKGVKHNQTARYWCWQQLLPLSKQRQQRPWDSCVFLSKMTV